MAFDERAYARKRAEQRQQSSWYKLKVGDNRFRILPTPPPKKITSETDRLFFKEYALHRDVGPQKVTVRCGIDPVSGEGECWICDKLIPHLQAKRLEQRASALQAKTQFLVQVASVDDDDKMTGPFLFTPAKTVADQLLASIFGAKKKSYTDPVRGYNISVSRTGTGKNDTKYGMITADEDPTPVPKALLDKLKPFAELKEVPIYSQAKQQAAYSGKSVDEVEPEQEEEQPRSRRRAVAEEVEEPVEDIDTEAEAVDEDDPDLDADEPVDGEDLPAEDEELVEEPPAPRAKPKAKPVAVRRPAPVEEVADEPLEDDIPDDIDLDAIDDEGDDAPDPEPVRRPAAKPGPRPVAAKPAARPASRVSAPNPKRR